MPRGHDGAASLTLPEPTRLVALDVDGTLITSDHRISRAAVTAIDDARARGIEIVLATSRGPPALAPVLRELGLFEPAVFVASQGAITASYTTAGRLDVLAQHPAPLPAARALVPMASAAGYSVHWFSGLHWYVSHVDQTVEAEAREVGAEPTVRDLLSETTPPDKLMLISPGDDVSTLRALAAQLPGGLEAHISNPRFLEITGAGVHKGTALETYCRRRGVPPAAVVAIGDGPNDLGLFDFAGTSIAPANARSEVLRAATLVTASNDDDGVALALNSLVP